MSSARPLAAVTRHSSPVAYHPWRLPRVACHGVCHPPNPPFAFLTHPDRFCRRSLLSFVECAPIAGKPGRTACNRPTGDRAAVAGRTESSHGARRGVGTSCRRSDPFPTHKNSHKAVKWQMQYRGVANLVPTGIKKIRPYLRIYLMSNE